MEEVIEIEILIFMKEKIYVKFFPWSKSDFKYESKMLMEIIDK